MIVITSLTWFPFPIWFILSPEGLGVINDVVAIQLGWAVLNIISKFSFVIHLQMSKNRHCKTLDATRELYGVQDTKDIPKNLQEVEDVDGEQDEKLKTLISETMVSLGMSAHAARFQKLMMENGVVSTDILERLTEDRAIDLNLPWSLCDAVQKRWRSEKMSMGQDGDEAHEKQDPFKKLLEEGKQRGKKPQLDGDVLQQLMGQAIPGTLTPPLAGLSMAAGFIQDGERRFENLEACLAQLMQQQQQMMYTMQTVADKVEKFDGAQEAICQRMDFSQQAQMQTLNSSQVLLHKVDSSQEAMTQKVTAQKHLLENLKEGQEKIYETISGANDANREALVDSVDKNSKALLTKLDSSQQLLLKNQSSSYALISQVHKSQEVMSSKADSHHDSSTRRFTEAQNAMEKKISTLAQDVAQSCEATTSQIKHMFLDEMKGVHYENSNSSETLQTGLAVQEERISDIRRQNMMIMDMLTTTQERVADSADTISSFTRASYQQDPGAKLEVELRGVISSEIGKLQRELCLAMGLTSPDDYGDNEYTFSGTPTTGKTSMLAAAAERIEQAVLRMDSKGPGGLASESSNLEEVVRRELSVVAMALAQQQRESAEQQLEQVGHTVRHELRETSGSLQSKVEQFEGALESSMDRFEKGVDKVLGGGDESKESRRKQRADRG